ncbi:hypothetical protein [Algoriphagus winogradskyi]|uniref:PD-(D/E)XK nuclease superfamily protein n=1 Tax=Algoriphagus winogradskyi TaxID=237017 RepID=A0ABY1NUE2_9BACT|nr:hypothetical protein [Algoriphagus winogradskyi]SMP17138.1 hypothetical protein SAMN06265367_102749 [Algoriphagus winogradskyi]
MTRLAPMATEILQYSSFFNEDPPSRISLLEGLSKDAILYELAYLNHLIKPKNRIFFDTSFDTQKEILKHLLKSDVLYTLYFRDFVNHFHGKSSPIIFFRGTFLYAIEEIYQSDEVNSIDGFKFENVGQWERLFKYLLAVNTELLKLKSKSKEADENPTFENLNPATLPINELLLEINPVFTVYRSFSMFDFFLKTEKYSENLIQYFNKTYGCMPKEFVQRIQSVIMHESYEDKKFGFWYPSNGEDPFLETLSRKTKSKVILKFIGIRKSPLIKVSNNEYLLSDSILLIEKCCSQFLNDFWFDFLKRNYKEIDEQNRAIEEFSGYFGRFFEQYCCGILRRIFEEYEHSIFLSLDQLAIPDSKGGSEFSDFYFRYNNKIIVGQIKSGSLNDKSKYGGDIESLYQKGREEFFSRFGVDQLAKSVSTLLEKAPLFDKGFPVGKQIHVFPLLVVNEKVFQTALFADVFSDRFEELTKGLINKKVCVKRMLLTHVSDWENSEAYLTESPRRIWGMFDSHFRDKKFVPAFSNTINKLIPVQKRIPNGFAERFLKFLR